MKTGSYMTRALRARDPRFARVLGKLGYSTGDMVPEPSPAPADDGDELAALRAEYKQAAGKRAYAGWDAETLRAKITAAKKPD